jgi:hypothetical protein
MALQNGIKVQKNALIPQTTFNQSQQVAAKKNSTFRKKIELLQPQDAGKLHERGRPDYFGCFQWRFAKAFGINITIQKIYLLQVYCNGQ